MAPLRAGDKLDHYLIENLVERSGMASIFRATDERTGSRVAIKVPHPEMEADPVFFERFNRERPEAGPPRRNESFRKRPP